ncbi:MAG: YafY family transcriptional regulator [Clostridiales bacterium]|nr:YafY family transcriptional regulator [Clostridiales bacterium]
MSVSRLFEMLYILLERDRVTAGELAQRLEVSVRTVYRDAQALCEAGIPLYAERGREGGLCLLPGCKLSKAYLTEEERRSVLSSLRALEQTGADDGQALRRLSAFWGSDTPDWVQIDLSDWSGHQGPLLATLKEAILKRQRLSFAYYGESGQPAQREVCPLRLCFKGRAWYLQAFCLLRGAMRLFKLSRIRQAQIVPGGFPAEAFEAVEHAQLLSGEEAAPVTLSVTLHLDACMAYRVYDDFSDQELTHLEDGSFLVQAVYPAGAWIASMILSYGEHAEVLAPQALRLEIAQTLKKMCARYQS